MVWRRYALFTTWRWFHDVGVARKFGSLPCDANYVQPHCVVFSSIARIYLSYFLIRPLFCNRKNREILQTTLNMAPTLRYLRLLLALLTVVCLDFAQAGSDASFTGTYS